MLRLLKIFGRAPVDPEQSDSRVESSTPPSPSPVAKAKEFHRAKSGQRALPGHGRKSGEHEHILLSANSSSALPGLTFTDYLARVRIEKAKTLLLAPNRRVSEVAYEVGFQSLTHFNRVFKAITGQSPSGYRLKAAKI